MRGTNLEVGVEFVGSEDLGDLDELVVVVVPVEEGLLAEDLRRNGGSAGCNSRE